MSFGHSRQDVLLLNNRFLLTINPLVCAVVLDSQLSHHVVAMSGVLLSDLRLAINIRVSLLFSWPRAFIVVILFIARKFIDGVSEIPYSNAHKLLLWAFLELA